MAGETFIHPTALVEPGAVLGAGVRVGPFCHVGPDVRLEDGVELVSHVVVTGATTLGAGTKVYPQAVLGAAPQNLKHKGGRSSLLIGRNCIIREAVTMHVGTDTNRGETVVGDNGHFMAYSHVAHDCVLGRNVTFANSATLAGHCDIGDFVTIGGLTAVHQFVRIGNNAFVGGCSAVLGDVIPYGIAAGNRAELRGLNIIGLKRSGMSRADIHALRRAYRIIFDRQHSLGEGIAAAKAELGELEPVRRIVAFLESREKRHFTMPPIRGSGDDGADDSD